MLSLQVTYTIEDIYMDKIVELSVENFKAVKKADITLNGITVVSGINGCGKSSLSQLLYYSFYYANAYDKMADDFLYKTLTESYYIDVLRQIEREVKGDNSPLGVTFIKLADKDEYLKYIEDLITRFSYYTDFVKDSGDENKINSCNRIIRIIQLVLNDSSVDLKNLLRFLLAQIEDVFNQAAQVQEKRYYKFLHDCLSFHVEGELPKEWEIKEYNVPFAGTRTSIVPLLHYIKRVAYIDTPMIVGSKLINGKDYWIELAKLLNSESYVDKNIPLYESLSEIMNGESTLEKDGIRESKLSYKRYDGKVFELKDCATGIKSFSILQLLLRNGFLKKDTLLVVDEPEAHLHPQWIVEYARMIVMLHKEIGVKFFIASHSTDMVSAIRYIAAKEEVQDSLNFYLAEDSEDAPYEYTYRDLKLDIDPIFKSFNKSFDKLDEYGLYD